MRSPNGSRSRNPHGLLKGCELDRPYWCGRARPQLAECCSPAASVPLSSEEEITQLEQRTAFPTSQTLQEKPLMFWKEILFTKKVAPPPFPQTPSPYYHTSPSNTRKSPPSPRGKQPRHRYPAPPTISHRVRVVRHRVYRVCRWGVLGRRALRGCGGSGF